MTIAVLGFLFPSVALAVTIGPAQTKRERAVRITERPSVPPKVTFEQIEESYLREDFRAVIEQSERYLSVGADIYESEEVRYRQALSLIKTDRLVEGRQLLRQIESHAVSPGMKARAAVSLADSYYFNHEVVEGQKLYQKALKDYPAYRDNLPGFVTRQAPPAPRPLQQAGIEEQIVYSVQVGSFSSQGNAERMLNRLLRNRYDAYTSQDAVSRLIRVRVGHLESREAAMAIEKRLQDDGYPTKVFP